MSISDMNRVAPENSWLVFLVEEQSGSSDENSSRNSLTVRNRSHVASCAPFPAVESGSGLVQMQLNCMCTGHQQPPTRLVYSGFILSFMIIKRKVKISGRQNKPVPIVIQIEVVFVGYIFLRRKINRISQ